MTVQLMDNTKKSTLNDKAVQKCIFIFLLNLEVLIIVFISSIHQASFEHVKVCPTPFILTKTFIVFVFDKLDN